MLFRVRSQTNETVEAIEKLLFCLHAKAWKIRVRRKTRKRLVKGITTDGIVEIENPRQIRFESQRSENPVRINV